MIQKRFHSSKAAHQQTGYRALVHNMQPIHLDRGAFLNAEFVIGHGAAPYRKGQELHSVSAAALITLDELRDLIAQRQ